MSQVRLLQSTGSSLQAGTVLASVNPTEVAAWTEVTGLGAIPSGGAMLELTATGGAMRVAVMHPPFAVAPPHNGTVIIDGGVFRQLVPTGARVWTKTP